MMKIRAGARHHREARRNKAHLRTLPHVIWRPIKALAPTSSAAALSALHTENELDVVIDALCAPSEFPTRRVYRFAA